MPHSLRALSLSDVIVQFIYSPHIRQRFNHVDLVIGCGTVLAWKNRYWGVAYRFYYTLVTIAAVASVWFLNYWNWLGWRY